MKCTVHYRLVVSRGAGLAALLDVLGAALGLGGLPRNVLLDVLALLPGDGRALAGGHLLALLLVHVLGGGGRHVGAHLVGDIVANLARGGHVVADLKCQESAGGGII